MPLSMQQNSKFAFQDWYAHDISAPIKTMSGNTPIVNSSIIKKEISGLVLLDIDPLANKVVRLYHKESGRMLSETVSNELGEYSFNHNVNDRHKYFIIAFDDMDNPVYQALALDDLSALTT